jgi:hypothetical protein
MQVETAMKRPCITTLIVILFLSFVVDSSASNLGGASGKPDVFCKVIKEPDPALMGSWKCMFERRLEEGGWETDPVEYRLIKYEDKYALYFYRVSRGGKKKYIGWREWTINGTEILSDTGVKIFTQNGEVFFVWQDGKPTRMTRTGVR